MNFCLKCTFYSAVTTNFRLFAIIRTSIVRIPHIFRYGVTLAIVSCIEATVRPGAAQEAQQPYVPVAPAADWRTIDTPHFAFHFPAALDAWTREAAARMEAERDAVGRAVGFLPPGRVTVLVADPYNDANGSAYPFLRDPAVFLWPVPADPRSQVGTARRWAELLTIHEFAHVAHLARPTRNPARRALAALLPTNVGPISARTPRWVWEGYATYVEGVLTRSGRPYGAWRPAFLRQWAVEGRLPSYAQVSGTGGFAGGSFAYLAGSAFLEWLVVQRGDSSLPAVWRRLTARTPRTFDQAFAGVFPGTPAQLYARWAAEVTAEALATEQAVRATGLVEGELVQRLAGATGDPAVSPDGARVALVVRSPGRASRVVVWGAGPEPRDTARARAVARLLERDREDVAAVPYLPPPRSVLAFLPARAGRAFAAPRWMPDGRSVLVERDEPLADGRFRPDLWRWDTRTGAVRRLTRGAAVRDADPAPDGRSAVATRCVSGWCDVVRVDLATGAVRSILEGTPTRSFARPRWDPTGARIVVAVQEEGRWRVVLADVDPRAESAVSLRDVGPDDGASRYDPVFAGRDTLLVTSEASGVPNIERLVIGRGSAEALTRVVGAAMAPERIRGSRGAFVLALRSTGYDLRRIALDTVVSPRAPLLLAGSVDAPPRAGAAIAPIASRIAPGRPTADAAAGAVATRVSSLPAPAYAASVLGPERAYGVGRTHVALLPAGAWTADGNSVSGFVSGADPVGRLSWVVQGAAGAPSTWRGGSLSAAVRVLPVPLELQGFGVAQRIGAESRYWGSVVALAPRVALSSGTIGGRLGVSTGRLTTNDSSSTRTLAFASARLATTQGRGDRLATLAFDGSGTRTTGDAVATRLFGRAAIALRTPLVAMRGSFARGTASATAPAYERFAVGGPEPALVDAGILTQRVAMPALPTATLVGRSVEIARVGLGRQLVEPYGWAVRTPDVSRDWLRIVGAEASFASGPIPFARAPGFRGVAGVAYLLDGPRRKHAQIYASMVVRP